MPRLKSWEVGDKPICFFQKIGGTTVDAKKIRRSPVEDDKYPHNLQGFHTCQVVFSPDF